jgi:DNA-binding GntR family transcriptional regulator
MSLEKTARRVRDAAESHRENLYLRLREDILSCALAPGLSLHENELAARFCVSKSPVRDALMRLEAERLVTVHARKGYRVSPISLADASDHFEYRALLEGETAYQAALGGGAEGIAALDRFRDMAAWEGPYGFINYNRDFHVGIAALCPNARIQAAAREVIEHFDRLVIMDMMITKSAEPTIMIAEHRQIVDAVRAGDGKKARRLMTSHVDKASRRVLSSLARTPIVP